MTLAQGSAPFRDRDPPPEPRRRTPTTRSFLRRQCDPLTSFIGHEEATSRLWGAGLTAHLRLESLPTHDP
jgi:hypothetical protein